MSKVFILFNVDESRESFDSVGTVLGVFRTKEAAEKFRDKYIRSEYGDTDFDDFMNEVELDVERVAKTSFAIVPFSVKG